MTKKTREMIPVMHFLMFTVYSVFPVYLYKMSIVMQEGPSPPNQKNIAKTATIRCLKRFTLKFKLLV